MIENNGTERLGVSRFGVRLWWSDRTLEDEWAVYVLSTAGSSVTAPVIVYVGMARDVRRRLGEHGRYWVGETGVAEVITVGSELGARRLEAALISLLNPTGNTQRPKLSWVENRYFEPFRALWQQGKVSICPQCFCVSEKETEADGWTIYRPVTEPYLKCLQHLGRTERFNAAVERILECEPSVVLTWPDGLFETFQRWVTEACAAVGLDEA